MNFFTQKFGKFTKVYYLCIVKLNEIFNIMDKQALLKYWAGELIAVKMELRKISFILQMGTEPTKEIEQALDALLDRKKYLEMLIEEFRKK